MIWIYVEITMNLLSKKGILKWHFNPTEYEFDLEKCLAYFLTSYNNKKEANLSRVDAGSKADFDFESRMQMRPENKALCLIE